MWNELHLVWNNVNRRKFRTALTTLAVMFGVGVIFATYILLPGVKAVAEGTVHPAGTSDMRVQAVTGGAFDPSLAATIGGVQGVGSTAGILRHEAALPLPDGTTATVEMIGVDPDAQQRVSRIVVRSGGRFLQAGDAGKVVLPASVADPAGVEPGDSFPLLTVDGLKDFTVTGVFDDRGFSMTPPVYVTLADAQAAFGLPGQINAVEVRLASGAQRAAVAERIVAALGSAYQIGNASTVDIGFLSAIFDLFGVMALFVGGFLIFNTFRTVVAERRREIGMLRSLGADRPQIMRLILMESGLQGVIGTALGLLAGYPFGILMASLISKAALSGSPIFLTLTPASFVLPIVLGIGTTLAAGFLPARTASSIPPLAALRPPSPEKGHVTLWTGILGAVTAAAGLVLMLKGQQTAALGSLGILAGAVLLTPLLVIPAARVSAPLIRRLFPDVGDVALGNVVRQPGRTAVTVTTLMVGVAVLVATMVLVGTERNSLFRTFDIQLASDSSDFTIVPGANFNASITSYEALTDKFGAGADLSRRIAGVPGVETVVSVRAGNALHDGAVIPLIGIDPELFPQVHRYGFQDALSGDPYAALAAGRAVFINGYLLDHQHLALGDMLSLQTARGTVEYQIVAVLDDYTSATGKNYAVISQENLALDFGVTADGQLLVRLSPGASREGARAALGAVLKDYPQFRLLDSVATQIAVRDSFNSGMVIFDVMLIAVLLPALLGLINTLAINIMERTTEIGLMRAVGTDRGMVRRLILAESLVLNLLGALIGFGVGAALSVTFIGALGEITPGDQTVFPLGTIAVYLVVFLILSLLVSLIPARNATRMSIVQALNNE
jgi:putative ABC transport system permease protein